MKMIQEYFLPNKKLSFEEWDKITAHKSGLWTWQLAGLLWFKKNGFDVVNIEVFDYEKFSKRGGKYLVDFFGEEVGKIQIAHSDIPQEIGFAGDFIKEIQTEVRLPTMDDMKSYLSKEYLILCNINARALYDRPGYSGHMIVVSDFTDTGLIIQDPGLPANEDYTVSFEQFKKAWAYPDEKAVALTALKLNNS